MATVLALAVQLGELVGAFEQWNDFDVEAVDDCKQPGR